MNKEYKFDGENTKVKMDNGEKEVKTVDNVYDILTEENIIEFINNLKKPKINFLLWRNLYMYEVGLSLIYVYFVIFTWNSL